MLCAFQVWTCDRQKKCFVLVEDSPIDIIERVIREANSELKIDGRSLVLESSGTPIKHNAVLLLKKEEVIMILQDNESWCINIIMNYSTDQSTTAEFNSSSDSNHDKENESFSLQRSSSSQSSVSSHVSSPPRSPLSVSTCDNRNVQNEVQSLSAASNSYPISPSPLELFQIPWSKLSTQTQQALEKGSREKEVALTLAHLIIDELRVAHGIITINALRAVAKQAVNKYPDALEDKESDGKTRAGDGYAGFLTVLKNRNINSNRKRNLKRGLDEALPIPFGMHRTARSLQAGCSNWQASESEVANSDIAENSRKYLLNIETMDLSNDAILSHCMKAFMESYDLRRLFFHGNILKKKIVKVEQIKEEWPCLFKKIFIFKHFDKLAKGDVVIDDLRSRITSFDGQLLLDHGFFSRKIEAVPSDANLDTKTWAILEFIHKQFKEDIGMTFMLYPENTSKDNITPDSDDIQIAVIGGKPADKEDTWKHLRKGLTKEYHLFMDKKHIEQASTLVEALQLLMASYYVFNRLYPLDSACFLGFLQQRFLRLHPDDGHSKARRQCKLDKINTLHGKLNSSKVNPSRS